MSTISVIIPTYNRAELLMRALRSVCEQIRPGDEIIVVDDGSSDDTKKRLEQYYPQASYLYQSNKGVSAARNLGIRHAKGNWLAFLDSDDEWLPDKLARQTYEINRDSNCRIIHGNEIWIRSGQRVNQMQKHAKHGGSIFRYCLPLCVISPSSVMIHRSVFDDVGLFDESLPACEDYDLWLRICSRYPVHYLEEPLIIKHGGHGDQLSLKYWGMDRFRIRALQKIIDSNILEPEDYFAAIDIMVKKSSIYLAGARKRNKQDEVDYYQDLINHYTSLDSLADDIRRQTNFN